MNLDLPDERSFVKFKDYFFSTDSKDEEVIISGKAYVEL
jgi:hypothetical protein